MGNIDPDVANAHSLWSGVTIAVPVKHLSNFFRSLELPLINIKLYIELNWTKNSIITDANLSSIFQITKTELYVPVVTLGTANNVKLNKLLEKGFKRYFGMNIKVKYRQ